jgi:hypothetical protein
MQATIRRTLIPAALGLMTLTAARGQAHAYEATATGLSVGAGLEGFLDATVTNSDGAPVHTQGAHLGVTALGNVGDAALGVSVAWLPEIISNGRLLLGARAGWQPTFGSTRVQILGDAGIHRFTHVESGFFETTTPSSFTTPYLGFQVGMTRSFFQGGLLEYGLALIARHDLRQQTAQHTKDSFDIFGTSEPAAPPTELRVGGTMVGLSLTIGFRIEKRHPRPETVDALDAINAVE